MLYDLVLPVPPFLACRAFGDMEFKGKAGLKLLLQKGIDFELWDKKFADSRCTTRTATTSEPAAACYL